MHKVPFYGILLSDVIGIKVYEFLNYSVKEKGIEVNKPHFDVGYVSNESLGKLIYRPTGVYIFGYSLNDLLQNAKDWFRIHVSEIDAEIDRLEATKNKLFKDLEDIGSVELDEQAYRPEYDYTIYLTVMASSYVAMVIGKNGDFRSQYTGTSTNDAHALWEGLYIALRNLHAGSGQRILIHSDNPDMNASFSLCSPTAKRIPYELMSLECFQGLSRLIPTLDLNVTRFDRSTKEYAICQAALLAWQ